jgi:hypothetical protein
LSIEVGGKKVGSGVLGAVVEELCTGLEIGEAAVEGERGMLEGREFVVEEGGHEGVTANGLAKGTGTGGELGRGAEEGESLAEGKGISWGQKRRGAGDRGEKFGFGKAEADAMGGTEMVKFGEIEGKVGIGEAGIGVVDVREAGGGGEGVVAGSGTGGEGEVEGGEDLMEDKASKEGAEGATLGETLMLEEERPGGSGGAVPTGVGVVIKHVEKGEKAGQGGMAAEDGAAGLP